ncbi:hypothetical protein ACEUBM_19335, partial [Aeromonas caviae]|uniref:hypothetical protein n=1 Tax=Aeromonas caviae TaxID=648 RepID=UPI0038CF3651
GERSSGSTYDLGNVSDSGSLSRYSKSTVRRHRRVSHFEVEFAGFINKKRSYVKNAISEYLANITHLELQVTSQIVLDLVDIAQSLTEEPDEKIDNNLANQIKEILMVQIKLWMLS